ncbi:VWA domain-containing protein [Streptomyces sp. GbtcB7]|uniref:vWA domain-containing protein n=1 Tax=Streptomyces sp. GbtcB7 TaxID=2824752 RepID=UPI001C2F9712|nr:VWA domain-containing protein [Streptomyces sp. GbtcB7]
MPRDPLDIPVSFRPLHFFWIVDTSGSMTQKSKIQQLNTAVKEALPHMRDAAREHVEAQVWVRVLKFDDVPSWITEPTLVDKFAWTTLDATYGARTAMGGALSEIADQLKMPPMVERGLPPVLALVTDGQPTDDFSSGLEKLNSELWAKKAVRVAIAIGDDADRDVLREFTGPEYPVLDANNPEQLTDHIRWASTKVVGAAAADRQHHGKNVVVLPPADDPGGDVVF